MSGADGSGAATTHGSTRKFGRFVVRRGSAVRLKVQ
jgi:hypothetical protein